MELAPQRGSRVHPAASLLLVCCSYDKAHIPILPRDSPILSWNGPKPNRGATITPATSHQKVMVVDVSPQPCLASPWRSGIKALLSAHRRRYASRTSLGLTG